MRRIDAIAITLGLFAVGGIAFVALRYFGVDLENAGVWSQVILITILIGWISTYAYRAITQTMTYNQQLDAYKKAVLEKRLAEMTPEEIAQLQTEVAAEHQSLSQNV